MTAATSPTTGMMEEPEWMRENRAPIDGESESKAIAPVQPMALSAQGETASTAAAVQAKTQVEARYMMAMHNPRSLMQFRARLLDACKRPRFAQTARYAKPVGNGKVVGWSIRFAEEAARCLGNLLVESAVIYDDASVRLVRVMVTDLETNLTYPTDVTVIKTVERSTLKPGQTAIKVRTNTSGKPTYLVEATEDDLLNKQNALISKAIRTGVLRVVPGDILEEAEETVARTVRAEDAQDPAAKAKQIADAFYSYGVMPTAIEKVLGHPLAQVTPAEVTMMRTWITAIKDGETTWRQIEEAFGQEKASADTAAAASLNDRLAKKRDGAAKAEPAKADDAKAEG
jgi:hypothetical protein